MPAESTDQFRRRVLGGETLFGLFLDLSSPASAELCGRAGYDWLLVDLEHGAGTEADLPSMLMAIESTGSAAMVRVQSGERIRIGRALDQGATGVMIPRMQSAAEVAEAVTFLRYPPAGVRGVALRTRGAGQGTVAHADVGQINDRIVGIVQIESAGAVDEVDAIAATDGVDVLFVGPADLSHSLGVPGQFESKPYVDRDRAGPRRVPRARQVARHPRLRHRSGAPPAGTGLPVRRHRRRWGARVGRRPRGARRRSGLSRRPGHSAPASRTCAGLRIAQRSRLPKASYARRCTRSSTRECSRGSIGEALGARRQPRHLSPAGPRLPRFRPGTLPPAWRQQTIGPAAAPGSRSGTPRHSPRTATCP